MIPNVSELIRKVSNMIPKVSKLIPALSRLIPALSNLIPALSKLSLVRACVRTYTSAPLNILQAFLCFFAASARCGNGVAANTSAALWGAPPPQWQTSSSPSAIALVETIRGTK